MSKLQDYTRSLPIERFKAMHRYQKSLSRRCLGKCAAALALSLAITPWSLAQSGSGASLDSSQSSSSSSSISIGNTENPSSASSSVTSVSSTTTKGTSISTQRSVTDEGEDIRVNVQEKNRDILIRQNDKDGITVRIAPSKKGKKPEINATAPTAKELKASHPDAYAVYRKYLESKLKELRTESKSQAVIPSNGQQKSGNPAENLIREQLNQVLQDPNIPDEQKRLIEKMLAR